MPQSISRAPRLVLSPSGSAWSRMAADKLGVLQSVGRSQVRSSARSWDGLDAAY